MRPSSGWPPSHALPAGRSPAGLLRRPPLEPAPPEAGAPLRCRRGAAETPRHHAPRTRTVGRGPAPRALDRAAPSRTGGHGPALPPYVCKTAIAGSTPAAASKSSPAPGDFGTCAAAHGTVEALGTGNVLMVSVGVTARRRTRAAGPADRLVSPASGRRQSPRRRGEVARLLHVPRGSRARPDRAAAHLLSAPPASRPPRGEPRRRCWAGAACRR